MNSVVTVTGSNNKPFILNLSASNVYIIYPEHDATGRYSRLVLSCGREVVLKETIEEINEQLRKNNE